MDSNDNHVTQLKKYNNLDDEGNHGDNHGKLRVVGDENTLCGCGSFKPSWAQYLANPKLFTAHCTAIVATLICCFAYFGAVLTTIERQFQLSSTESGGLAIINDVVSLTLVLFVSYFGHKGHRPRWIAWGAVIVAIGFFMFAMPHFASPPADPNDLIYGKKFTGASLCKLDSNSETSSEEIAAVNVTTNNTSSPVVACEKPSSTLGPVWWLVFGNVIAGIGQSGMYPLMTTYIDDAVGKRRLVSFTAFLFMAFAIGPACGFLLSSFTTRLYVDFDRISEDDIPDINQYDPRWIGAWWLGFVALGSVMILLAIPMFFYPKVMIDHIPEDEEEANDGDAEKDDVEDAMGGKSILDRKDGQNGTVEIIKDLLFSIKRLFTNITLMSLTLAGSAETASIGIFASFSVKYLQTQFGLSPGQSGMLVGALIPMNIFSNLASAWIIRRFKMTSKQCALFVIIVLSISGTMLPVLMTIGCPNQDFAGLTVPYPSDTVDEDVYRYRRTVYSLITDNPLSITKQSANAEFSATCNEDCSCSNEIFQPVCDVSNGVTYISACHAGCTGQNTTYTDCSCLSLSSNGTAEQGQCPYKCDSSRLPISMVVFGLSFFIMALTGNPLIFITLRCVKDEDRSVALGFKSLITKVLGFFPSPIYFGAIINATCIYWQYTCGERGACWTYDIVKYRYSYFGTLLVLRVLGLICYVAVYLSIKPEKSKTPPNVIKNPDEALELKSKNKSEEL